MLRLVASIHLLVGRSSLCSTSLPHQVDRLRRVAWKGTRLNREPRPPLFLVLQLVQKSQALAVPFEAFLELDLDSGVSA
jgi:hypothetical protein